MPPRSLIKNEWTRQLVIALLMGVLLVVCVVGAAAYTAVHAVEPAAPSTEREALTLAPRDCFGLSLAVPSDWSVRETTHRGAPLLVLGGSESDGRYGPQLQISKLALAESGESGESGEVGVRMSAAMALVLSDAERAQLAPLRAQPVEVDGSLSARMLAGRTRTRDPRVDVVPTDASQHLAVIWADDRVFWVVYLIDQAPWMPVSQQEASRLEAYLRERHQRDGELFRQIVKSASLSDG